MRSAVVEPLSSSPRGIVKAALPVALIELDIPSPRATLRVPAHAPGPRRHEGDLHGMPPLRARHRRRGARPAARDEVSTPADTRP